MKNAGRVPAQGGAPDDWEATSTATLQRMGVPTPGGINKGDRSGIGGVLYHSEE